MRVIFGIGGILVVLVIVALLAKKQLGAVHSVQVPTPASSSASGNGNGNVQQQSQQIQQQFKAAAEAALQQPRSASE